MPPTHRPPIVAVIGPGDAAPTELVRAEEVGRLLARAGCVVVSGGLGGAMAAASKGAADAGGTVLAILPGSDPASANPHATLVVATGMGDARNAIIADTAQGFIAVGGSYGTLSEIALARKRGKPVIALDSWAVDESILTARDPEDAVRQILERIARP